MLRPRWLLMALLPACTTYMQDTKPSGPPGPQEAKVVFCRPSRFIAGGVDFPLWDGETMIGMAESGRCFEYRCAPGEHVFLTKAQSYKAIPATLAGGSSYYVWVTPRVGAWATAVGFTPVRVEDAELLGDVKAVLQDARYRGPVAAGCASFQASHSDHVHDAIAKFRAGEYSFEPPLRPEDGHREP